jgi:predicted GIY-YIG superfamily endonuclease
MKNYKVCIIEGKKTKSRFIEYTDKSLSERLKELNSGKKNLKKWILKNRPFKIVYHELHDTKRDAVERVNYLKNEKRLTPAIFDRRIEDRRKEDVPHLPERRYIERRARERRGARRVFPA